MSLYVLKFGGSSVATPARINHISEIISEFISDGHRIVVVTSAMQGVTNQLIELTKSFSDSPFNREYDAVVSSGEQVAAGLLAMALNSKGIQARSMTAWQVPIEVCGTYSDAEISHVGSKKLLDQLDRGIIPVVTGFQGISRMGDVCTIGRGGSDATACAVAKFINADECLIYTDVDGVYTADPRIVLDAQRIDNISYDDMIELASWGAKVLQNKSTLIAKDYRVSLRVLSSFSDGLGTKVSDKTDYVLKGPIAGIAHTLDYLILKVQNHSRTKQLLAQYIKDDLSKDLIHNKIPGSFLILKSYQSEIKNILDENKIEFEIDNDIGLVTVVGDIKGGSPELVSGDKFPIMHEILETIDNAIQNLGINNRKVMIREQSISVIVPFQQTVPLVNKLHEMFLEKR